MFDESQPEESIVYIERTPVIKSELYRVFGLVDVFSYIVVNSADPDDMLLCVAFHLGIELI